MLLDAHDPVKRGGTGRTIDWVQAASAAKVRPIILSGGLTAENVGEAVRAVRPYTVDVSSGVESGPGIKDLGQVACALRRSRCRTYESFFRPPRSGRPRLLRPLRRPLRSRDARRARCRARGCLPRGAGDESFRRELADLLRHYVGRPTPLYEARRLSASLGGARILLKREDLAHTGAHKINNAHRPGAAREADGEAPRHRRDRRRTARRRDRDGLRAPRSRVRRLHGRRRHGAAGAQRLPHGAARRDGSARRRRQPHAEGRDQRGDARLGDERRPTATTCSDRCSARTRIR